MDNTYPENYPPDLKKLSEETKKLWSGQFLGHRINETLHMDVSYMGLSAGSIKLSTLGVTQVGSAQCLHIRGKASTSKYYRYIYELDDTINTFIDLNEKVPIKYSLIQKESDKSVDDLQLFDLEKLKTYTFYKKVTPKKIKKKSGEHFIPKYFVDPISLIYFVRSLPLELGHDYSIPVVNKGEVIILKLKVKKNEQLKTKIGTKKAILVGITSDYSGETLKGGEIKLWFSADNERVFLRFEAEIAVGAITGQVTRYFPGKPLNL